jgi:hypothetical protein
MNTMQVIIMWYGGLGVFAILLFSALSEDSAKSLIAAVAVLTGLGIVTAGSGTRVRKGWVAVWVVIPVLVTVAAGYYWATHP